jgi:hypothetical protein
LEVGNAEDTGSHLLGEYRLNFDHRQPRNEVAHALGRQELVHLGSAHLLVVVLSKALVSKKLSAI